jgi:hypothetical protein
MILSDILIAMELILRNQIVVTLEGYIKIPKSEKLTWVYDIKKSQAILEQPAMKLKRKKENQLRIFLAITSFWISDVPSPIVHNFESL